MAAKGKMVMKKPAGKSARAKAESSKATTAKATEATKRRPAASSAQVSQKRRKIVSAIKGVAELPPDVREMLAGLVEKSVGAKDGQVHPYHEQASTMVAGALADMEGQLRGLLTTARAKVSGSASDKEASAEALQIAEDNLPLLKAALADKKAALTAAGKAIQVAQRDVQVYKIAEKTATLALRVHTKRKDHLRQTEEESYGALKDAPALGPQGQKQLKTLRKVGREFGFHEVLLEALPAILKKQPDRRRTFDTSALTHLEAEFQKRACKIDADIKTQQADLDAKHAAVQTAEEAVHLAELQREVASAELQAAEAGLAAGKQTLKDTRKQLQKLDADAVRAVRELSRIEADYNEFARGPLAAFQEIQGHQASSEVAVANVQAQESTARAESQGTLTVTSAAPETLTEVIATLPQAGKKAPGASAHVQEPCQAVWA